jgi:uncharacterized protein
MGNEMSASVGRKMLNKREILAAVKAQFKLDWHGDHGVRHWGRVYGRGVLLCRSEEGADVEVVKSFALLHDACRVNEWEDPEHGPRAAFFARRLWSDGLIDLSPQQMDTLTYAIQNHTLPKVTSDNITVRCCFDSDRLDLGRVGISPDPKRMYTRTGAKMAKAMKANLWESEVWHA